MLVAIGLLDAVNATDSLRILARHQPRQSSLAGCSLSALGISLESHRLLTVW
jgi:hypothetical protein